MSNPVTYARATYVKQLCANQYEVDLQNDWAIGSVPNGGYVTGCILEVVAQHFATTLSRQNQPHTMALHVEYPRRTQVGPAKFIVKEIKLGRQTSTVHVTVNQNGEDTVLCYLTQTNITAMAGPSADCGWTLQPPPKPVDFALLKAGKDPNWLEWTDMPYPEFRKASARMRFHYLRGDQVIPNGSDQWIQLRSGEKWTMASLPFVADMFPLIYETVTSSHLTGEELMKREKAAAKYWYPTLVLNLEIKKVLPKEGVDWLFSRSTTKQIKNGRYDIEVVIMDTEGELVALSHHVALIIDASRNLAKRSSKEASKM